MQIQFRICEALKISDPPKESFAKNKLKFDNGKEEVELWSVVPEKPKDVLEDITGIFRFKVQLPQDLTYEHCVFQWWCL
jgi:hypothetical protein